MDEEKIPNRHEIWRGKLGEKEIQLREKSMQCVTLYKLVEARVILRTWKSRGNSHSQHPCHISCLHGSTFSPLLGKGADDFGGDVEEEYGRDEGEGKDEDNEGVTTAAILASILTDSGGKKKQNNTYTRSPGESSVYSLSMVLDDPPAPAARDELGLETCDAPARRL